VNSYDHLLPQAVDGRWWTTSSPLLPRNPLLESDRPGSRGIKRGRTWEYDARCRVHAHTAGLGEIPVLYGAINLGNDHLSQRAAVDPRKFIGSAGMATKSIYISARPAGELHWKHRRCDSLRSTFLLCRQ